MRWAPRLALRWLEPNHMELGYLGEVIAARFLGRQGHRIRARRLRTLHGEIDLLTSHAHGWSCVEVKTGRLGPRFSPGSRLGQPQIKRLHRAAALIARGEGRPCRLELVEVCLDRQGQLLELRHHPNLARWLSRPDESCSSRPAQERRASPRPRS